MIQQLLAIVGDKHNKSLALKRYLQKYEVKLAYDKMSEKDRQLFYDAVYELDLRTARRIADENTPIEALSTNQLRTKAKQKCIRNYYKMNRQSLIGALKK